VYFLALGADTAGRRDYRTLARDMFKELIEIKST